MWARKESRQLVFTAIEKVLVGVVVALSVAAVIGFIQGFVSV